MRQCFLILFSAFLGMIAASARTSMAQQNNYAQPTEALGVVPEGSYHVFQADTVNIGNGNVLIDIPLLAYPQRGDLSLSFSAKTNSSAWQLGNTCDSAYTDCEFYYYNYAPSSNNNAAGVGVQAGPRVLVDQGWGVIFDTYSKQHDSTTIFLATQYFAVDSNQGQHPLYYDSTNYAHLRSTDGTKLLFNASASQPYNYSQATGYGVIVDSRGIQYSQGSSSTSSYTSTDLHGNVITFKPNANITDSVGRTIPWPETGTSGGTSACPNISQLYGAQNQALLSSVLWAVPGANGATATYRICYATVNIHTNFFGNNGQSFQSDNVPGSCGDENESACNDTQLWVEQNTSTTAIQSIVLPDGTFWAFVYDSANPASATSFAYGNITKLILPTGGTVDYGYAIGASCSVADPNIADLMTSVPYTGYIQTFHVTSRTEHDWNGNSYSWTYKPINAAAIYTGGTVTDPNGNDTVYSWDSGPNTNGCGATVEASRTIYQGAASANKPLRVVTTKHQWYAPPSNSDVIALFPYPGSAASVVQSVSDVTDGVATSVQSSTYDSAFSAAFPICSANTSNHCSLDTLGGSVAISMGLPITQTLSSAAGKVLTSEQIGYQWQTDSRYWSGDLINTRTTVTVNDGSGNQIKKTTNTYDESTYSTCGVCGEVTSKTDWNNSGSDIQTHTAYTITGMVDHQVDGRGNTAVSYTYGSQYSGLYPTTTGNALSQSTTTVYDFNTGKPTSVTDPNSNATTCSLDNAGRVTKITRPDTGTTQYTYSTDTTPVVTELPTITSSIANGTATPITQSFTFDGLARKVKAGLTSDPAGADWVITTYDGLNQITSESAPFRGTESGVTSYKHDALGRTTIQIQIDGSQKQWCFDAIVTTGQTNCQPNRSNLTSVLVATMTDESGNSTQQISDVFGRQVGVVEPNSSTGVLAPQTTYGYDSLNNLTSVVQSGISGETARTRGFTYDSISRLLTATNPETATICYGQVSGSNCVNGYDGNGNLLYKTDARGILTSYSYDAVNRLLSKTYPAGTLSSCYEYDQSSLVASGGNLVGRLTNSWTQVGACPSPTSPPPFQSAGILSRKSVLAYDAIGHVKNVQQCTKSNCNTRTSYAPSYAYDLAGNIISNSSGIASGPFALTFTNGYDSAGHLCSILNGATALFRTPQYGSGSGCTSTSSTPGYSPAGGLMNATFGAGLQLSRSYDNRLRIISETDTGNATPSLAPGAATITISGTDQTR